MQSPEKKLPVALVVDDDDIMRTLVREALKRFDFEVVEAAYGARALDLMAAATPDLVFLDVTMPGMDGFEVCRRIRERWDGTQVPVVMMTALDDVQSINRAYESGASDFINKPINWPVLGHRARYVLRSA